MKNPFISEKKRKKKYVEEVESDFPDMVMQLILLLNAGMVCSAAFRRLCAMNSESSAPLYRELCDIQRRCDEVNLSFTSELYAFAKKCGSRDLLRFAALVSESSGRGSELADKLDRERSWLWASRLARARTRAAEAGTRLSIPLMMLMVSLVIISAAPALMQM